MLLSVPALGVGSRGEPAQAAVRALRVVLDAPVLDQHLRLKQAVELLDGQELVAQPAVERLDEWVFPRRTGLDVAAGGAGEPAPVAQGVGRELGSIIATDVPRRRSAPGDDPVEGAGGGVGGDAPGATIASASRVCSSTMLSSFRTRPSAVWSNWKSSAQTWFGRSARSRTAGTAESPRR